MDATNARVKDALHSALHQSAQPAKEIASRMNIKYSYLARAVIQGESGCNFPVEWLVAFVRITGRVQVLKIIANACGYMLVRNPKGFKNLDQLKMTLFAYQRRFDGVLDALVLCINEPTGENCAKAAEELKVHQEETEHWRRVVGSRNVSQLRLDFSQ